MTAAPPTVLLFVNEFLGRSATFIHEQLGELSRTCRVSVVARRRANEDLFPYDDVTVVPRRRDERIVAGWIRGSGVGTGDWTPQGSWKLRREIDRIRPAIVHAHFGMMGLEIWRAARAAGVPVVVTFHGHDASRMLRNKAYVRALAPMLRYATALPVSEEMGERLRAVAGPEAKIHPLHLGIDTAKFALSRRTPPAEKLAAGERVRILQVSRFVDKKGHEYSVRAFAQIASELPSTELVLAGEGPLLQSVRDLADSLGVKDRVSFPGPLDTAGVVAAMADADILVQPSVTAPNGDMEGLPTVLMEAMASGLPVVSTLHAGTPELVRDGISGFLAPERDAEAFAECMRRAIAHGGEVVEPARRTLEAEFDTAIQTRRLLEVYAGIDSRFRSAADATGRRE